MRRLQNSASPSIREGRACAVPKRLWPRRRGEGNSSMDSPVSSHLCSCGSACLSLLFVALTVSPAIGADDAFERAPISYSTSTPHDAISVLKTKLASGAIRLEGDEKQVVRDLLRALEIPEASQMLVFSKTSFQKDRIDPAHPRAIYFSDDVYLGWCPGGLVEVAAIDPLLGPVFYSFDPHVENDGVVFRRDEDCLRCHGGTFVRDIPGLLARSVFTGRDGNPLLALGSELVDSATPIEKRWGGWYVTALRAGERHRGNLILSTEQEPAQKELAASANLNGLEKLVNTRPYLVPSSDVVALLVFEHQVGVQNALTRANQECLRMMVYQKNLQKELKETVTEEPTYESVRRVFSSASQDVLDALLCKDETALPEGGIQGVGGFAKIFGSKGKLNPDVPCLKQLDLRTRLFKYRCSYLIQSTSFDRLQPTLRRRVLQRLWRVLTDTSTEPRYAYLEEGERDSIREILTASLRNLPASWRAAN